MIPESSAVLSLTEVRFGFSGKPDFLGPITLSVHSGECWAIVGPNGAGKSTLLRLMGGFWRPRAGVVSVEGTDIQALGHRRRAQRVAFVPQVPPGDIDLSVRQVVLLGRFPHRSLGLFESTADQRIAEEALELSGTLALADRPMRTLSGGEAQRVHLAAALAQEPRLLLLDEPTASLDLQHQLAIFGLLRNGALGAGLSVVVVTHDVNLAIRFCSHVLLLDQGKPAAMGTPAEVLTPATLGPVYAVEMATASIQGDPDRRWVVAIGETGRVQQ